MAADGVYESEVAQLREALAKEGAQAKLVAPHLGTIKGAKGTDLKVDFSLLTAASVLFDAVYLPGGGAAALAAEPEALEFIHDAFKHCKTVGANAEHANLLRTADRALDALLGKDPQALAKAFNKQGVVVGPSGAAKALISGFIQAMDEGRHWIREANMPL